LDFIISNNCKKFICKFIIMNNVSMFLQRQIQIYVHILNQCYLGG
jgi:hypothetical protein